MRRTVLLTVLLLVAAMPVVAVAQGRTQTAPHVIAGVLQGTLTFVPFGTGLFDVNTLGVTSGTVKGLGMTNLFTFHQPTAEGTVENGRFFLVAADGDRINGTYVGTTEPGPEPNLLIGRAEWVITGGTGRFAHASGTINATAYVTFVSFEVFEWPAVWVVEGTIDY